MANPWFRVWSEMINDPKWRTIARISKQRIGDVVAVYVHMMTCASNATERGRTEGWSDEDVATALDMDTEQVAAVREAMQGRVLDGDHLTGWEKRQPLREDGSADRSKEWREAQKEAQRAEEDRLRTLANAAERNQPLDKIRRDTDTDKSKDKAAQAPSGKAKKAKASAYDASSFVIPDWVPAKPWYDYLLMRVEKKKAPTERACELVVIELSKLLSAGQDVEAVLNKSTVNGWTDVYALKPNEVAAMRGKHGGNGGKQNYQDGIGPDGKF